MTTLSECKMRLDICLNILIINEVFLLIWNDRLWNITPYLYRAVVQGLNDQEPIDQGSVGVRVDVKDP